MDSEYVTIGAITEKTTTPRRRRLSTTKVDVESVDNSNVGAEALATTIKSAAAEGSIIANIQKAAAENGVLTQELYDMPRKVTVTTVVKADTKTVMVEVPAPTPAPVDDPAGDFSAGTSVAPAFGTVMAIFALSMVWTGL